MPQLGRNIISITKNPIKIFRWLHQVHVLGLHNILWLGSKHYYLSWLKFITFTVHNGLFGKKKKCHSIFITHHSSLKIPQFPNSTRLAHIFNFSSLKFFYFLWDSYLSNGQRLLLAYLPNPHLPPFSSLHISFCHHHSHSLTQKLHSQFNQRSTNNKNSQQFNTT